MNISILILMFLLLITVAVPVVFYILTMLDSMIIGHDLPSSRIALKKIVDIISIYKKREGVFYDLGCSRGSFALALKKALPTLNIYAFDKSPLRISLARIKNQFAPLKVTFSKSDIFALKLKRADIIYTYLWYDLMPPLEQKLDRELRSGTLVITNTSKLPHWRPIETIITHPDKPDFEKLFVYIKA